MAFFGRNLKKVIAVETICHFRIIISHEKEHFMFILKITLVKKGQDSQTRVLTVSESSLTLFLSGQGEPFSLFMKKTQRRLKAPSVPGF